MTQSPHARDEDLVALVDETLPEGDARTIRSHLADCPLCQERSQHIDHLIARLARVPPGSAARIAAIVHDATTREPRRPARRRLLPAAAAVASLLLALVIAIREDEAAFQARGAGRGSPPDVHLVLHAVLSPDGQRSARLADGDVIRAPLALSTTLQAMPGAHRRFAAAFARDAEGRVTWLFPAWLVATDSPHCLRVPDEPTVLGPGPAVVLEDLPEGALEVALLVFDEPCTLRALDGLVEGNAALLPGTLDGLVRVERLTLFVREAS